MNRKNPHFRTVHRCHGVPGRCAQAGVHPLASRNGTPYGDGRLVNQNTFFLNSSEFYCVLRTLQVQN